MMRHPRFSILVSLSLVAAAFSACGKPVRDFGTAAGASGNGSGASNTGGGGASSGAGNVSGAGNTQGSGASSGSPSAGGTNSGGTSSTSAGAGGEGGEVLPACGAPTTPCCLGDTCVVGATCNSGTCECGGTLTACDAVCADLDSDAKNCGQCGHDCLGGACDTGTCQPFTIAQNQFHFDSGLASDGTYAYWGGNPMSVQAHFLARRRLDASDNVIMLSSLENGSSQGDGVNGIALTGDTIFWLAPAFDNMGGTIGHSVRYCDLPDCTNAADDYLPMPVSNFYPCNYILFAPANGSLFWSCSDTYNGAKSGTLWSLAISDTPPSPTNPVAVGANPANPQGIVSDGAYLYWVNSSSYVSNVRQADAAVFRYQLSDGTLKTLVAAHAADYPTDLAVANDTLYFIATFPTRIVTVPLPNGTTTPPTFATIANVGHIVADADYVYFATYGVGLDGYIARCPHSDCSSPELLATGQENVVALAQDAVSILWTSYNNGNNGTVRRLAK